MYIDRHLRCGVSVTSLSFLTLPKLLRSSGTEINIRPLTRNFQFSIFNFKFLTWYVLPLILRPYGDEFASFDQLLQFGEGGVAATFADALEGGAAEAVVGDEVLFQALLDGGVGEVLVACGASAHNLGSSHGMPQLGAGGEGDAAHADVLRGDVVFLAFVAAGEGEAEGSHVVYLDAVAIEQGLGNALPHGLQHSGYIALGGRAGMVDVVGHLLGGDHATAHDAHAHRGVLLGGLAGEVVTFVQLVGNGARFLGGGSLFHIVLSFSVSEFFSLVFNVLVVVFVICDFVICKIAKMRVLFLFVTYFSQNYTIFSNYCLLDSVRA